MISNEDRQKAPLLDQVLSASSVLAGRLVPVVRMDYGVQGSPCSKATG
ncbi:hypothetical protein [Arthrobacter sp. NPDC057013]